MNKTLILNQIIQEYNFKNDSEFATFLGINPQVVYNWKKRNTFNQTLLIDKLKDLNKMFLLTGEGSIRNTTSATSTTSPSYEALIREKDRIISEQAQHISTLKQSLNINAKVIDVMSETLKRTMVGEGLPKHKLNKKAASAG